MYGIYDEFNKALLIGKWEHREIAQIIANGLNANLRKKNNKSKEENLSTDRYKVVPIDQRGIKI
jgi:trehalose-6-phosphate synthase